MGVVKGFFTREMAKPIAHCNSQGYLLDWDLATGNIHGNRNFFALFQIQNCMETDRLQAISGRPTIYASVDVDWKQ